MAESQTEERGGGLNFHRRHAEITAEAFARPSLPLACPAMVTRLTVAPEPDGALHDIAADHLALLCRDVGVEPPLRDTRHFVIDTPEWKLVWERHTEFISFTVVVEGECDLSWKTTAIDRMPARWAATLPGAIISATKLAITPVLYDIEPMAQAEHSFGSKDFTAMRAPQEPLTVAANFRPDQDGFAQIILFDNGAGSEFRGRLTQRLLEVDFYRLAALLTLPVARGLGRDIDRLEDELEDCLSELSAEGGPQNDSHLLNGLAVIAGKVGKLEQDTRYRFDAARAYYQIVQDRIVRLREERVDGRQRIGTFMDHRLAPAMRTCEAVRSRLGSLEERVARAVSLLSTRVSVSMEQQNAQRLDALNKRFAAQLRLQETVEGLSTVAISYYAVGLIQYALKAIKGAGGPDLVTVGTGIAIPVVLVLVFFGVRRIRQLLGGHGLEDD